MFVFRDHVNIHCRHFELHCFLLYSLPANPVIEAALLKKHYWFTGIACERALAIQKEKWEGLLKINFLQCHYGMLSIAWWDLKKKVFLILNSTTKCRQHCRVSGYSLRRNSDSVIDLGSKSYNFTAAMSPSMNFQNMTAVQMDKLMICFCLSTFYQAFTTQSDMHQTWHCTVRQRCPSCTVWQAKNLQGRCYRSQEH